MYRFATAPAGCVTLGRAAPVNHAQEASPPLLSVAQILRLVERRLAWYGLGDWRIKDVVCNAAPSVTVIVRGPGGLAAPRAQLALTIARDGAPSKAEFKPAARLAPAPQGIAPYIARAHVKDRGFKDAGSASARAAGRDYVLKPPV